MSSAPQTVTVPQALQAGLEHHQAGRLPQAEQAYRLALQLDAANPDALHLLGVIAAQVGKNEIAVDLFDRALAVKPDFAEALSNRGNALQELKRYEEALASYEKALSIKAGIAEALSNRGNALTALKRYDEALASYDRALLIKLDYPEALHNRGIALIALKRYDDALANYDQALAIKPEFAEALCSRGNVLQELRQLDAAVASYDRAIAIRPGYAEAYSNRGNALLKRMHAQAALASHDRAIAIKPDYAEGHSNRGYALEELGQLDAAMASYDRAIALKPAFAEACSNKAFLLLLRGDFERGWALNEWRWKREEVSGSARDFPRPLWLGRESLAGKTILLHSEQGFGDTIQFCRYARLVADLGARVILEAPRPLMHLLEGLAGVAELVAAGSPLPAFDFHCPLLSLPLAFNTNLGTIPASQRYLGAEAERLAEWRERLGEQTKPRIGLVWSGRPEHKHDHNRSIALADLIRYLPPHYQYVSLQKEVRDADRPSLASRPDILHFGDALRDFADSAALCELMRLVISVDTSVAHLAGALGKPVWLLLPSRPDWRWLLDRADSPWYPSARLFRKETIGSWDGVLARVETELMQLS